MVQTNMNDDADHILHDDRYWMQYAIQLSQGLSAQTSPNPSVGAVLIKDGEVVGLGAHLKAGEPHAEVHALRMAGDKARDAVMYVTLEPCVHHGKTPPCTEAIIEAGVKKVVIGSRDPNPKVQGKGIKRLREAGIEVIEGVEQASVAWMNRFFFTRMQYGRPYVTIKMAMTLDGKIATKTGDSRWISSEPSRQYVHALRRTYDAIMIGSGTALSDDPLLTPRLDRHSVTLTVKKNPLRIVVDGSLKLPPTLRLFQDRSAPTLVITREDASMDAMHSLRRLGVDILTVPSSDVLSNETKWIVEATADVDHQAQDQQHQHDQNRNVNLQQALKLLSDRGVQSVLVEGGGNLNASLLQEGLVDEMLLFIAPKVIGGVAAKTPVEGSGLAQMGAAYPFEIMAVQRLGEDILIRTRLKH